jgi:15-cis-phytoene synthase
LNNFDIYNTISKDCSKNIAKKFSTSFYSAIKLLHKDLQQPICDIYGFVRLADEIVDTFHEYDKQVLFDDFKKQTYTAIDLKISLNPVLQSFQQTVNTYHIGKDLIDAFLHSMELDLSKKIYSQKEYETYIYGSAEVVGLMCLCIFCNGNKETYNQLLPYAKKLGAAFQKINFLRDIKADAEGLQRMYFPDCDFKNFTPKDKERIEKDIAKDFEEGLAGIKMLPQKARFGVYVAYEYYIGLFKKIKTQSPDAILNNRIRISNHIKAMIVANAGIKYKLNLL